MSTCENCGRETDALLPVTIYGGPDGSFDQEWCAHCVSEEAEDLGGATAPRLEDLVRFAEAKAMDRQFGFDTPPLSPDNGKAEQ